ncbi:MAG: EutN/CcmL family microcompartment protein [Oscillospiraceae bacterium]|nr:EutN/CcmL family microcompartment protein [Oscillospiraceae bacterium]
MRRGVVTGAVWSTKKASGLTGLPLLEVSAAGGVVVAADLVGAGIGEQVLLSFGGAARLAHPEAPVDAAVIAILDPEPENL